MQSIVVHGHFYQPPREDPWLEIVERDHSAHPYHDWNERIEQDCYRAVVAARVLDGEGRIARVVNLLERMSFNVGATLLAWLDREAPSTYDAILRADAESAARLGHGNAMAMPYHHLILPLASRRDKITEVRWGIRDFQRRFRRDPEGMWLPETAVDEETLEVLALEGIRFTVLAPHQLAPVPLHGLPGAVRVGGGRHLAVFPYDGQIAHEVAFGPLVRDAAAWAARMILPPDDVHGPKLVAVATDGETYGHHHPFGEMALASMFEKVHRAGVRIENFASFLARNPPLDSVELAAPSSWSCAHGVERWRSDCGCRTKDGTSQAWRRPLREALDWLKGRLDDLFVREGAAFFTDPWVARDAHDLEHPRDLPLRARELLEMQHHALRMFTSCGWFFDDIAGTESLICLRHAARAIDFAGEAADELRAGLRARLAHAHSNDPAAGTGADVLDRAVFPRHPPEHRVAAAATAIAAVAGGVAPPALGVCDVRLGEHGAVVVRHTRTGRETTFETRVAMDGTARLRAEVAEPWSPARELGFADLPEPARATLRRLTQARLVEQAFNQVERDALAAGTKSFAQVLERAMVRHLGGDAATADLEALAAALDLLALDSRPVPFDVQTRFHLLMHRADHDGRARLTPLAPRFGFTSDCCRGER